MEQPKDAWSWIDEVAGRWKSQGLWREARTRQGRCGQTLKINGRKLLNFGGNDYLGLAGDPRLLDAAMQAARREGWGAGASPVVCGRSQSHHELELVLAKNFSSPAALSFPSGYATNVGVLQALVNKGDAVFSDEANHASIIDGCRLSKAQVLVFRHGDYEHLATLLNENTCFEKRLIVTDSVFSMDGDAADVAALVELASKHGAMLLVDEAHAFGVVGPQGEGVAAAQGVADRVLRVGTLSKAFGASGGFVLGPRPVVEWVRQRARTYFFSTAHPPALAAAAQMGVQIARNEPWRREALSAMSAYLRSALTQQGWRVPPGGTPIIPVLFRTETQAVDVSQSLASHGFFAPGIRPPSVPRGGSRLRISLSAACYWEDVQALAQVMEQVYSQGMADCVA